MKRVGGALVSATVVAISFLSNAALADHDHDRHDSNVRGRVVVEGRFYDNRYHHDHYYYPRGYTVDIVPRSSVVVRFGGSPYYFNEGMWYRPYGPRFTVVAPPFGLVVPILPPSYSTVWVRGNPYYYANDVYYTWRPEDHGYVVTRPPGDDEVSTDTPSPKSDDLFVYPKTGQDEKRQASDRYECHSWAANETHYDPTQSNGGAVASDAKEKRANYFRAMTACLEGRGYSVK